MKSIAAIALTALMLSATAPALAQTRRAITGNCHGGECYESFVLNQQQLWQGTVRQATARLIQVNLEVESYADEDNPTVTKSPHTVWVQCSTEEPFVASQDEQRWYIDHLNPGGQVLNPYRSAHQIYWAICHNNWESDVMSPALGLDRQARQLGYPLNLPEEQRSLPQALFRR